jgi:adenylate cyclase class 2
LAVVDRPRGVGDPEEVAVLQPRRRFSLGPVVGRGFYVFVVGACGLLGFVGFVAHTPHDSRRTLNNHVSRRSGSRGVFHGAGGVLTMYEVELKLRVDHERVRPRIDSIGAERVGTVRQVDTYYDHPVRDFGETDEALRVRRETDGTDGGTAEITYKGPLADEESKTREELETALGDGETGERILEAVGFEPAATVEKERERFERGEYTIALDTVVGLGEFLEVETEAEEIAPAREGAVELLEALGLDAGEGIRRSYLGMLLEG